MADGKHKLERRRVSVLPSRMFWLWRDLGFRNPLLLEGKQLGSSSLQEARLLADKIREKIKQPIYISADSESPVLNKRRRDRRVRTLIHVEGSHHNLQAILDKISKKYFSNKMRVAITWGKGLQNQRRVRSIKYAAYMPKLHLIKVHPALDQDWVPQSVLEAIIFHELLHIALPPYKRSKNLIVHSREFRDIESQYPGYASYQQWKKVNRNKFIQGTSIKTLEDNFEKYRGRYGLGKNDLNRVFKGSQGRTYRLAGLKPRRSKYPVIGINVESGVRGKFSPQWVKEHWS